MIRNIIYLDTEFIRHEKGIELVSVGLVKQTGDFYYAISSEFHPDLASEWVQTHILSTLELEIVRKPLAQIAQEIPVFVGRQVAEFWGYLATYDWWLILQLYGGDIQKLPYNMPIYCKELRQEIERLRLPHAALPARPEKHHALADARWCKQVGDFLQI